MKLSIYLAFFSLILTFYGLPINVLRDVYLTARSFLRKCRDLKRWREATKNMGSRYATATEAEMQHLADKTCIICREEMQYEDAKDRAERLRVTAPRTGGWFRRFMPKRTAQDDTPKKLLCGHVFHFHCLRSWLERQQSCPTWSVHLVLTRNFAEPLLVEDLCFSLELLQLPYQRARSKMPPLDNLQLLNPVKRQRYNLRQQQHLCKVALNQHPQVDYPRLLLWHLHHLIRCQHVIPSSSSNCRKI